MRWGEHKWGGGRGREREKDRERRERIPSKIHAASAEPESGPDPTDCETTTGAKS